MRSPALRNEEVGWARSEQLRLLRRPMSLEVDLSERELTVHDPGRGDRRIPVAIGAPDTPHPAGDYYVTDKLNGYEFGPFYGCCILALSGRQPNLPEGWSGGDRLAIHGSPTPTWGQAVSNGCLHADEADLRYLMKTVPLGTRVVDPRVDSVDGSRLAELHTHLGGSVASEILWSLAHEQGIALPVRDYWEFDSLVTVSDPQGVADLNALDQIYHWTELIQSSPLAVERSVHAAIGGAYRSQGITTLELRFNPMKRNRGGERDLDHIIMAAVRGLDRASLEYPQVRAGLILMMDRTFDERQNSIIVEKAIRYAPRGIVGIDIAGPRPSQDGPYPYRELSPLVEEARSAGLGVTIHVGEEGGEHGIAEIREVVGSLRPERIGHGILAAKDPGADGAAERREDHARDLPHLEPLTKALPDEDAVRDTFRAFTDAGVPFTIATDGPEMMRTHLRDEFELLLRGSARSTRRSSAKRTAAVTRRAVQPSA